MNEDNNIIVKEREVGQGNFSIGSAVKGGLISVKIDLNKIEDTKKMIDVAVQLQRMVENNNKLNGAI